MVHGPLVFMSSLFLLFGSSISFVFFIVTTCRD
jgi:hypothetical protein